jgi:hypothetical protein
MPSRLREQVQLASCSLQLDDRKRDTQAFVRILYCAHEAIGKSAANPGPMDYLENLSTCELAAEKGDSLCIFFKAFPQPL